MLRFLMVSTVLQKKQFSIFTVNEENAFERIQALKTRHNLILFPLMSREHVNYVWDLIQSDERMRLLSQIQSEGNKKLMIINFNNRKFSNVLRIEHIHDDFFRFVLEEGNVITWSFKLTTEDV